MAVVIRKHSEIQLDPTQALLNLIKTDTSLILIAVGAVSNKSHRAGIRVDLDLKDRLISLSAKSGLKCHADSSSR